jgi:hypothetical protein
VEMKVGQYVVSYMTCFDLCLFDRFFCAHVKSADNVDVDRTDILHGLFLSNSGGRCQGQAERPSVDSFVPRAAPQCI